jgi:hypothetical protein
MATDSKLIASRLTNLRQRVESNDKRIASLTHDAEMFIKDTYWDDRRTRGVFASQLIYEAQSKLSEIAISTRNFDVDIDHMPELIAVCEVFLTIACDLLNRAGRVLDDVEDIWGVRRPTGGLHDK